MELEGQPIVRLGSAWLLASGRGVCSSTEQVSRAWFIREKSIYPRKSESKTKFLGDSRATTSIKSLLLPKSKNTQDRWSCTFFNIDSWGLTPFLKNEHWNLSHCWWEQTKQSCFLFLRLQMILFFSWWIQSFWFFNPPTLKSIHPSPLPLLNIWARLC